jgi:hypothetical protein
VSSGRTDLSVTANVAASVEDSMYLFLNFSKFVPLLFCGLSF